MTTEAPARARPDAPLVRTAELAQLRQAAAGAAAGRTAVMALDGGVGLGKTTLLDALRTEAAERDMTVLATRGRAADAELGFSALLTLLRPLEPAFDELAGDLAGELRAALALGRRPADPVAVALATFHLLTGAAERRPLLLAIDDAHLLDRATADVLAFALGRCGADPVLAVVAGTAGDEPLGELVTRSLRLEPLDDDRLAELVTARYPLAPEPLRRCLELAEGNPLTALEVAGSLDPAQREGDRPMPAIPRPVGVLAQAFARRCAALGDAARNALAVVAADDTGDATVVGAALRRLGEPDGGLAEAEAAGLVEIAGGEVRLAHPLLRPVAYHQVASASRRAAHRALAAVLGGPHQGASRAWQLVAGADGPDETVAGSLALVAADASRRGATTSAARTFEGAAALTPHPGNRRDRLASAVAAWLAAGDGAAAARVATELTDAAASPSPAVAAVTAAALRLGRGTAPALTYLQRAVAAASPGERAGVEAVLATELLDAGAADEAVVLAGPLSEGTGAARQLARAVLSTAHGRPADPTIGGAPAEGAADGAGTATGDDGGDRMGAAPVPLPERALAERAAAASVEAGVEAGRAREVVASTPPVLAVGGAPVRTAVGRARALLACGDVAGAGDELRRLDTLVPDRAGTLRGPLDLALAEVDLLAGRHDDARARIDRVATMAARTGAGGLRARTDWLAGRLALAAGDHRGALGPLRAACRVSPHLRLADLVAAAVAAGRPSEASARAAPLRDLVDHPDPAVAIRACRARGSTGARAAFAEAVERADAAGLPLEAAEALMALAEWARCDGDTDTATSAASEAADRFAVLGVAGWDGRLAALERTGRPAAVASLTGRLSPAEQRVALVVGEGRTNQEAAEALFLSVKTVDFHLQNIYRKLGLRSRTELAVLVQRGEDAA
ncbi:MAG TPA: LuxR family transcriptional regulator [Acidimicrobiales bacterium]